MINKFHSKKIEVTVSVAMETFPWHQERVKFLIYIKIKRNMDGVILYIYWLCRVGERQSFSSPVDKMECCLENPPYTLSGIRNSGSHLLICHVPLCKLWQRFTTTLHSIWGFRKMCIKILVCLLVWRENSVAWKSPFRYLIWKDHICFLNWERQTKIWWKWDSQSLCSQRFWDEEAW